jgi:hypothetical protein
MRFSCCICVVRHSLALPRIRHAPRRADAGRAGALDGAKDEHAVLPIMGEGPAILPSESKKIPRHDRQHDNDLRSGEDARPARSGEHGSLHVSLAQPHGQARYSILSSV